MGTVMAHDGRSGSIGMWWSKEEFVKEALQVEHPFDSEVVVPQRIAKVIFTIATEGPTWIEENRKRTLEWYRAARESLEKKETALHEALHPDVEVVVKSKNILLFKTMLEDIGYDDMGVVRILTDGLKIVGNLEAIGIWKKDDSKGAKCSIEQVWANAKVSQETVLKTRPTKDEDLEQEVWNATMTEVEDKLLRGPYSRESLSDEVGALWVAARRFGIRQGQKVRPIDNFAEHLVNDAFGAREKVKLLSIDHVIAWARAWLGAVDEHRNVSILDAGGGRWIGELHRDWSLTEWRDLKGRVADLRNAYKQVAVHPAHSAFSVVAVQNPQGGKVELFRAVALMFGETAAVYGFLRISRALAALCARLFHLLLVEFFDDFTQIEPGRTSASAMSTLESMFGLLGWDVSMAVTKRFDFDTSFVSLGVQVDFCSAQVGEITVRNKPGRLESIKEAIMKITEQKSLGFKEALSIKGKLTYAEGQLFYRVAAPACRLLSRWAQCGADKPLTLEMEAILMSVCEALSNARPKIIRPRWSCSPVIVFTDGACEDQCTSVGGVIFEAGGNPEAFGAIMAPEVVESWASKVGQKQMIGQAELFPLLVARLTWASKLRGKRVIFFIDNDSARLACIKAYSPILASLHIIMDCVKWDCANNCSSWYARVPTASNVGDDPSRMSATLLQKRFGARIVKPVFPIGSWATDVL